jgi:uncharacterized protein YaaN involved in tellurite resistance
MPSSNDNEIRARLCAESAQHIIAATSSIEQSKEHVRASRKAIARSLRTLGKRYTPGSSDDLG